MPSAPPLSRRFLACGGGGLLRLLGALLLPR